MIVYPKTCVRQLDWGQTTRVGGVSHGGFSSLNLASHTGDYPLAVAENWRRFASYSTWSRNTLATCSQVHGDKVVLAKIGGELNCEADALISRDAGVAVGVFTADCVPVLLADGYSGVVAAVHCGWRGAQARLLSKTIYYMEKFCESMPLKIHAYMGASIGQRNYEVGQEVATQFADKHLLEHPNDSRKRLLDVAGSLQAELLAAGVPASQIERSSDDTFAQEDRYFSYRRDGAATGRMLSYVGFRR